MITNKKITSLFSLAGILFSLSFSAPTHAVSAKGDAEPAWKTEAYMRLKEAHEIIDSKTLSSFNKKKLLSNQLKEVRDSLSGEKLAFVAHPITSAKMASYALILKSEIKALSNKVPDTKQDLHDTLKEIEEEVKAINW